MPSVGLVVVSHSLPLAQAAVELAMLMVHKDPPVVEIAAGTQDGGFGTDPEQVFNSILQADQGDGVAVFMDLGSALTSTDFALELLAQTDSEVRVEVLSAPLVEGLTAAVVLAAGGADLDTIVKEANAGLVPKIEMLKQPEDQPENTPDTDSTWEAYEITTVVNQFGLHARPAAQIAQVAAAYSAYIELVKNEHAVNAASPIAIATLNATPGDSIKVQAKGTDAFSAVQSIVSLINSGFGENLASTAQAARTLPSEKQHLPGIQADSVSGDESQKNVSTPISGSDLKRGYGVSCGKSVGLLRHFGTEIHAPDPVTIPETQVASEIKLLTDALEKVAETYLAQAQSSNPQASDILQATARFAADVTLRDNASKLIRQNHANAANALWNAISELISQLESGNDILRARATDLQDIRTKALSHITGLKAPEIPHSEVPFVLAAKDLAPADTAKLQNTKIVAIITESGSYTSHTSLLARSMGIPAVAGFTGIQSLPEGVPVMVDGDTGEIILDPSPSQAKGAMTRITELEPLSDPGATADGHQIQLLANIGTPEQASLAVKAGAQGIGLFRTEFAYLNQTQEPSVAAQAETYRQLISAFSTVETGIEEEKQARITIRTLDTGSDKPVKFLPLPDEHNPALGLRGIRTQRKYPDALRRQLEAIALGAPEAWVMAPMVSIVEEAAEFTQLARDTGLKHVGVMVETPAAALCAKELYEIVDFISIGTNDLTQYTFAADRQQAELNYLQDALSLPVLRLVRLVGAAAQACGKPLSVCGESAGRPDAAPLLVGLGATSLSMNPRQLSAVSKSLARYSLAQCQRLASTALQL